MKDQYVRDIGDYGKYGLLRFLAKMGKIKIGVNWYRTKNDDPPTNDGKMNAYLNDAASFSRFDEALFKELQKIDPENRWETKSVIDIEAANLIPNAVYYHEILDTTSHPRNRREDIREQWHQDAIRALDDTELIFADPDNGILDDDKKPEKNAEKYVLPKELKAYYHSGKDLVYYCHRARRSVESWKKTVTTMQSHCIDSSIFVLTSHRGTQRSYIFVIHPESKEKYEKLLRTFIEKDWGTVKMKSWKAPFFTLDDCSI